MKPRLARGLGDLTAAPFGSIRSVPVTGSAPATGPISATGPAPAVTTGPARPRRPAIVCVTSGKGGTGKSVLTSNLAVHLAATGVRVMAIDCDLGLANLHLLLGVRPRRSLMEVIENGAGLDTIAEIGPVGLRLVAGGSGVPEMADLHPARLRRLLAAMEGLGDRTDVVLVDTGAGIGRATTVFIYALDEVLVVTTPDLTAMTDAYAVIKNVAHHNANARISVVVNRARSAMEGLEVFGRIDQISQRFLGRRLLFLGHVLDDERVPISVAARLPILLNQPGAPAAACLRGVGRALLLEVEARRTGQASQNETARETGTRETRQGSGS